MSDSIKIDMSALDNLLKQLSDEKYNQGDLFYDDSMTTSTASASTISQVAGNTWPYVSGSTGGYTLHTNNTGSFNYNQNLVWSEPYSDSGLKVKGNAEFDGDVKIKGVSISEMFAKIEERLAILHPNEELEAKWEQLRELRKQYIELEKDILEKEKIWGILKK